DAHAEVRSSVIAAVAPLAPTSARIAEALLGLADAADPPVRFQVALALGNWNDRRAGAALARIARRDGSDPWMRAAVLTSAIPPLSTVLATVIGDARDAPAPALIEPLLAIAGALPGQALTASIARSIGEPSGQRGRYAPWQFAALAGLIDARRRTHGNQALDL